ncbi:MAG TPA: hypothetical protein ENJ30_02070 [Desulfobulbaceae bacterium]|nr:hypothetical protein [Desulfobulbaceae bacterium]
MSEVRTPDAIWRFRIAGEDGKKTLKIELFRAGQWRRSWRPYKRNMYPRPPIRKPEYWHTRYRLRIDGRWFGKEGFKYRFLTIEQATRLVSRLTINQF